MAFGVEVEHDGVAVVKASFVESGDVEPSRSYAFSIRNLRDIHVATFDEAGLHDGDTVVFHLNAKRQVDRLDPVTTS